MLIIEILMLIAGIWAIAAGKLPSWLFGGARYKLEGQGVRLLGLILVLPLPAAFLAGVLLALIGDQATGYAAAVELVIVLACGIAAVVVSQSVRQPVIPAGGDGDTAEDLSNVEAIIAKKAQGSLIYALLGILGFSAILVCPLAFIRANQALRLIDKYQIGEQHRGKAKAARIIAPIIFLFYAAIVVIILAIGISGW
jgi:hypothetical protein